MELCVVGTSHRLAPIMVRERMFVRRESIPDLLSEIVSPDGEAMALSTCNRTELYLVTADHAKSASSARRALSTRGELQDAALDELVYTYRGAEAALHLCRVAAGLDSLVPGEPQILGQVRVAYEDARRLGATGPFLNQLCRQALRAGKRVRSDTSFGHGPASVPDAAVRLAARIFGDLARSSVLVVGAGEAGTLAVKAFKKRGANLVVANRSEDVGEALAAQLGAQARPLREIEQAVAEADVVIASTSAESYVLTEPQVRAALSARAGRPLFLIDLSVPRNLEPAINDVAGCYLYGLDDLEAVVADATSDQDEAMIAAEGIALAEARSFATWRHERAVVPAIARLRRRAEQIRSAELARAAGRLEDLTPRERRAVEAMSAQIVSKLLHEPIVRLKEAAGESQGDEYADTVTFLFDLDD